MYSKAVFNIYGKHKTNISNMMDVQIDILGEIFMLTYEIGIVVI